MNTKTKTIINLWNLLHQSLLEAEGRIAGDGDSGIASGNDYSIKLGNGTKVLGYDYEGDDDNIEMCSYNHLKNQYFYLSFYHPYCW